MIVNGSVFCLNIKILANSARRRLGLSAFPNFL